MGRLMGDLQLRTIRSHERATVLDLLGEWLGDRAFFARYFDFDPTFRDDLCFVACDGERIVSTMQIFRKQIRAGSAVLQVGCVGNVFTKTAYRERGLASRLLRMGVEAMMQHGFDLSLLFAIRLKFYTDLGWQSHLRHLVYLEPGVIDGEGPYDITAFCTGDLGGVRALYDEYSGALPGTTVRDDSYWVGQLRYAGNPHEDFLVARHRGEIVAYARGTPLYDVYVVTEHGRRSEHAAALAQIIRRLHARYASSWPGTITHLGIDPEVLELLSRSGMVSRTVEDVFWMWRVIDPTRVACKLGLSENEVRAEKFFDRLLPPTDSVYWISDRF